jgi:hypothetical protein
MALPAYDHIVVVVFENHDYSQIIGNPLAPYINTLATGGASLDNFRGLTHPSEGNYFALYAGSTFGLTSDDRFAEPDPSIATILQDAGKTFTGWVEHNGSSIDHNPWESFPEGTTVEQDFATFPTSNFASLPTVSFISPNVFDDMHDGTIAQGDSWLQANLSNYAQWAVANNSLLIVTWDEGDSSPINQVPTILYGAHVVAGAYNTAYTHLNLLSTILGSYNLAAPRDAATAPPIAVFDTGALGPTGPGPTDLGSGNGRTIATSIAGPVIMTTVDNPLSITSSGVVTASGVNVDAVDSSLGATTINNDGTVTSAAGFGFNLGGSGTITNGPRFRTAASIFGGNGGIRISGVNGKVTNYGRIDGATGIVLANGGSVINKTSASLTGTGFAIFAYGNPTTVTNSGVVTGTNSTGVLLGLGGGVTNTSGATITGGGDGVYIKSATGTVINSGTIRSNGGAGVDLGAGGKVTNNLASTITGQQFGVFLGGAPGTVANYGVIAGTMSDGIVLAAGGSVTNATGATISGGSNAIYVKYRAAGTVTNFGTVTAAGGAAIDLADGGTVTNAVSASISGSVFGVFIAGAVGTVANSGAIAGASYDGILLAAGGSVSNAAGATILGGSNAVYVKYRGAGTVTNSGGITALGGAGVDLAGGGTVTNTIGASISADAIGVFITGASGTVNNNGVISGASHDGVVLGTGGQVGNTAGATISGGGNGIYVKSGAFGTITNSGGISGGDAGVDLAQGGGVANGVGGSISGGGLGIFAAGAAATVSNSGTISSARNIGIDLQAGGSVTNATGGVITAPGFGVAVYGVGATVTNSGTISGGICSVRFSNPGVNRLVVDPTAVFNGTVVGGSVPTNNTIELAGGTGTISALSGGTGSVTEGGHTWGFSGFGTLMFDAGGTWIMSGTNTAEGVVNQGVVEVAGTLNVVTAIDAASSGIFQLDAGSRLEVAAAFGIAPISFIAGSALLIDTAASFGTGQGTASYTGPVLQNFGIGDTIDIKDFANAALNYNAATGLLQITGGALTADLAFQVSTLGGGSFHAASDGATGMLITRS